jgi:hypothetical protein
MITSRVLDRAYLRVVHGVADLPRVDHVREAPPSGNHREPVGVVAARRDPMERPRDARRDRHGHPPGVAEGAGVGFSAASGAAPIAPFSASPKGP